MSFTMDGYRLLKEAERSDEKSTLDVIEVYDKWEEYEKFVCNGNRKPDPALVAEALASYLKHNKSAAILDVACGTGLGALELAEHGFHNVDGLDGSQGMVNQSKERGLYNKTFVSLFSEKPTEGLESCSYDATISTGSFGAKHLEAASLVEFVRLTKTGGFIIIGILEDFLAQDPDTRTFETVLQTLCDQGKCQLIQKRVCPVFDFQRRPGFVFVIQKK